MDENIKRQAHRRPTPEDKLREALAKKPIGSYSYAPRGMLVGGKIKAQASLPSQGIVRQSPTRPVPPPPILAPQVTDAANVLFTGGIGDFLAIDSFLSKESRSKISHVLLATRAQKAIVELLSANDNYKHVKPVVVFDDWSKLFCFLSKEEVIRAVKPTPLLESCLDLSISKVFPQILSGTLKYQGSAFAENPNADIFWFNLPARYVVICPHSINDRRQGKRDFNPDDWLNVFDYLTRTEQMGVVLNVGGDPIPFHKNIINLSNKTTIAEAIEIVKWSRGYFGIDSCLSVMASKALQYPSLLIKTLNRHLIDHKSAYYSPHFEFNFLSDSMNPLKTLS